MPYGCADTAARAAATQTAHRARPPLSSARSKASVHASDRHRKRLYIRPYTPWNRNSQLGATSSRGDEADPRPAEPAPERRDERQTRERERRGDDPEASEPEAEMRHRPREQEVERRAAALLRDVLDDARQRVPTDEERQRLVLVRGPRHQLVEEEPGGHEPDAGHAEPHPVPVDAGGDGRGGRLGRRLQGRLDPLRHRGFRHPRW